MREREILALEEAAFAAWPAAEVLNLDGWRLRHTAPGITRRANSVWPGAARGDRGLDERIEASEAFYAERGVPPRVQLTPVSQPAGLDAVLAARGWEPEAPVSIQTASAASLPPTQDASVALAPDPDWLAVAARRSRFRDAQPALQGFLDRIGPAAGFALARAGGEPVATGLGVHRGPWVGVFAMLTVPEHRGRGLARAVLHALGGWARDRGATGLYLQVERDNPAALALYAGAGFHEVYGYHYRCGPTPGDPG